uniref:ATP synthase complex subunit 8 n=1 Tax=Cicadellinae sp. EMHAU-2015-Zz060410 TaxID=2036852 RepID=A0A343K1G4_9HEMI|nr:ATP synthase F0 subunit 8 [Cicadellinae sp. EMHAU-2015-Zz060410]QUO99351.1 ATP synthase F0 subunit 8 [Atkinsoniella grahami]
MPQMAPMWWTSLMILFIMTLLLMMNIIYFNMLSKSTKNNQIFIKQMNWKW